MLMKNMEWSDAIKLIKQNRARPIDEIDELEEKEIVTISNITVEGYTDLPKSVSHIIFENIKFQECEFIDINFDVVTFTRCRFDMCKFQNCTFNKVTSEYTAVFCTPFEKCQFRLPHFYMIGVTDGGFNDIKLLYGEMNACTIASVTINNVEWRFGCISRSTITNIGIKYAALIGSRVIDSSIIRPTHWNNLEIDAFTNFSECNITPDFSEVSNDSRFGEILSESMIGYKVVLGNNLLDDEQINPFYPNDQFNTCTLMRLEIPVGAIVFTDDYHNFRTNKVKVIKIYNYNRAYSIGSYLDIFGAKPQSWYVGDEINIKNFDLRYNIHCSTGIHFFKYEADALELLKTFGKESIKLNEYPQIIWKSMMINTMNNIHKNRINNRTHNELTNKEE